MKEEKKSQNEIVLDVLKEKGFITNLWAIQNYILRLGARINDLRDGGFEIETLYGDDQFQGKKVGKNTHYVLKEGNTLFS